MFWLKLTVLNKERVIFLYVSCDSEWAVCVIIKFVTTVLVLKKNSTHEVSTNYVVFYLCKFCILLLEIK